MDLYLWQHIIRKQTVHYLIKTLKLYDMVLSEQNTKVYVRLITTQKNKNNGDKLNISKRSK